MRYRMMRFPNNKPKAATFSYDDGCRADIKLSKILNEYGIKCTFNLNSAWLGKTSEDWHLTPDEIREHIINKGHEIAVHGEYHKANGNVRAIEGIQDVLNCRLGLEKEFGFIIRGMAYPDTGITHFTNGITMNAIGTYLKQLDIAYSRTLGGSNDSFNLPSDWYQWMPNAHHNGENVFKLIEDFVSLKSTYLAASVPKIFYLWGHAYEFDNDNNWDRLEEICQKLGGKEDIWYATNIEIYDYVAAYNSLVFSADSSIIYNPSVKTLWFEIDGKSYKIEPGETLKIEE